MSNLEELVRLIHARNETDEEISGIIGRPAEKGHVGEYIASKVFDIALEHAATEKAHDGRFTTGPPCREDSKHKVVWKEGGAT